MDEEDKESLKEWVELETVDSVDGFDAGSLVDLKSDFDDGSVSELRACELL